MLHAVSLVVITVFSAFYSAVAIIDVGILGCWLGGQCAYRPKNVLQLQACGIAGHLNGLHTKNLILCLEVETESQCKETKTEDSKACVWVHTPKGRYEDIYGKDSGTCLPSVVAGPIEFIAQEAIRIYLDGLKKMNVADADIPTPLEQVDCQKHSYDEAACLKASDRKGRPCGWCSGLNPKFFPYVPESSSTCVQQRLIDLKACEYLKEDMPVCSILG